METRNYLGIEPLLGEFRAHLRLTTHDLDGVLFSALKAGVNRAEHEISTVIVGIVLLPRCFALLYHKMYGIP